MKLTIETKFDLGQTAVAFNTSKKKLQDIEIVEVQFDTDGINTYIWYRDKSTRELFREKDLYTSRDEFIEQL